MNHDRKISVTGLGYVGQSSAVSFGKVGKVLGFDIDTKRIEELKANKDRNKEFTEEELKATHIEYTSNPNDLMKADFHIVTVPTPINKFKRPDLAWLLAATKTIGDHLKKGDIVVYESTVYPGATEEECIPLLEKTSGLKCGKDFGVGFSPERVNPSDKKHTLETVIKVVSAIDEGTLKIMSEVYKTIVKPGVYPVSKIRVAEATKIIENTQRDLNISFMNEITLILYNLDISVKEVLNAASTKWNFIPYTPGIVGGHCIGVNSYYLAYKSEEANYYPNFILSGRRVNELIPKFLARETIKKLIHMNVNIKKARIAVLGITYKENCNDFRDTGVTSLINELESFGVEVLVHDPLADPLAVKNALGIHLVSWDELTSLEAIIIAVGHQQYKEHDVNDFTHRMNNGKIIVDVKGILDPQKVAEADLNLWQL